MRRIRFFSLLIAAAMITASNVSIPAFTQGTAAPDSDSGNNPSELQAEFGDPSCVDDLCRFDGSDRLPAAVGMTDTEDETAAENEARRSICDLKIYIDGELDHSITRVYEYQGYEIKPCTDIFDGNEELVPDKDYTVAYSRNNEPGTAHMTITGKDKYKDVYEYSFEIKKYEDIVRFNAAKETPDFYDIYTDNGVDLARPYAGSFDTMDTSDGYEFQSNDNGTVDFIGAKGGIWYLKIPAMFKSGWYYDRPDFTMEIRAGSLRNNEAAQAVDIPNTVVTIGGEAFRGMKSVKRIYVPVSVKRIGEDAFAELPESFRMVCCKGSYAEEYAKANDIPYVYPGDDDFDKQALEKAQPDIRDLTILIDGLVFSSFDTALNYEYTGREITPPVVIKDGDKTLTPDVDYTLCYINNKDIGKARVVAEGKDNYKGRCVFYFYIKDHADIMPYDPVMGDIDGDNSVTANDALIALRASLGFEELTQDQITQADLDGDLEITSADALAILRRSIGIKTDNNVGNPVKT